MDFGPLDMLQLMQTVYAVPPPAPVDPVPPVPFVPGNFDDMWCRNPQGDKVEWYIMYKVPATTMSRGSSESISNGVQYGYIDSATKLESSVRMRMFEDVSSTKDNALYNTLDVLFKYPKGFLSEKNLTFLAYSDSPPPEINSSTNGISKGVLLFGANSGAWVVHTFDGFGQFFKESYSFPEDARRQAQMALCMSLTSQNWPKIVSHLRRESPNIYDWSVSTTMFENYPELKQLVEKNFNHADPGVESAVFKGVNDTDFLGFAKNAIHNYDIFETLVAPGLEANLYLHGTPDADDQQYLTNYCNDFNLTEVQEVELKLEGDVTFKKVRKSQDNTKWAVSERDYWVCFGSVGRKKSHLPRGAEAFCFQNQQANILLANSVDKFESCKKLPDDIAAKVAAAAPGTAVAVGTTGETYVRPVIVRPLFGVPRYYYGGLPSLGFGFPFTKILKNPIVVGAAVAGVMHYRHKQQIKKLNAMHAMSSGGYGGFGGRSAYNPSFGGSGGSQYSSGLAGLFGGSKTHTGGGGYPYPPPSYGGYPAPGFQSSGGYNPGYPTQHSYPAPPAYSPYPQPGHAYPNAPHAGYPQTSYPHAGASPPHGPPPPYSQQPAHNPSFNSAPKPQSPAAPSAPSSPITPKTQRPNNAPVRVEKTVTKTVTTYEAPRSNSRPSSFSGRSRSSSRSSSRGGGRGGGRGGRG